MPSLRRIVSAALLASGVGGLLGGCSADPGSPGDSENVGQTEQELTTCILGCCTGAPKLTFDMSDPFQAQLAAWGCKKPRLYSPNQATGAWWYWSQCADPSLKIEKFLTSNPVYATPPYSASVTTGLNPICVPAPPTGAVDVLWDPTCTTCKSH